MQPALANGTVLDLVLTLESISGYASMAIERREANGTTHRRVPIVSHSGVERASLHGSRFGAGTHYTVAVVANTAAATYELQIEAYPAEQTVAAADLAVRASFPCACATGGFPCDTHMQHHTHAYCATVCWTWRRS